MVGATVEIYDAGDTVINKPDKTILFDGQGKEKENLERQPLFMQYFKKHGFNDEHVQSDDYQQFIDSEDKDLYMYH